MQVYSSNFLRQQLACKLINKKRKNADGKSTATDCFCLCGHCRAFDTQVSNIYFSIALIVQLLDNNCSKTFLKQQETKNFI